jgi:hypothetical protein
LFFFLQSVILFFHQEKKKKKNSKIKTQGGQECKFLLFAAQEEIVVCNCTKREIESEW